MIFSEAVIGWSVSAAYPCNTYQIVTMHAILSRLHKATNPIMELFPRSLTAS